MDKLSIRIVRENGRLRVSLVNDRGIVDSSFQSTLDGALEIVRHLVCQGNLGEVDAQGNPQ